MSLLSNPYRTGFLSIFVITFIIIMAFVPAISMAQTAISFTFAGGAGLFIAQDKDYYAGISTDLYPEIGMQLNVTIIKLGLKAGFIYRKITESGYSYYGTYYSSYSYEYTFAFIPAQGEFLIAPLGRNIISPYAGMMAGAFIPVGDNDKVLVAISPKVGGELNFGPFAPYGDIRYTYAKDGDWNAGGFMIVIGLGIKLPSE